MKVKFDDIHLIVTFCPWCSEESFVCEIEDLGVTYVPGESIITHWLKGGGKCNACGRSIGECGNGEIDETNIK